MLVTLAVTFAAVCSPQGLSDRIQSLCDRSSGVAHATEIGRTRQRRPIPLVTIASGGQLDTRPGILILAGADGRRALDTELALHQCAKLVDDLAAGDAATAAALERFVFYVIPQLNPDGAALGRHGNAASLDLDRDGAFDEDVAEDLNGDGVISWMRWPADDGEWIIDPDEPRLLREADADAGERATHRFAIESRDADGDGERAEDDAQGVWIDRTLPHLWDEFDRRTGPFSTSEPETKALIDFVYAHRNIVTAFVWGRDDNLLETPKVTKPEPRVQNDGILEDDKKLFERAGKAYREATDREGKNAARFDGSPWAWLYLQAGIPTFATDVWRAPKLETEEKSDKLIRQKRRLAQCDAMERGFVAWQPFDHPELGAIEIGGMIDEDETALLAAPERAAVFDAHHAFCLEASTWQAHCEITTLTAKQLAANAYEVNAVVTNRGELPALTATASRCQRFSTPRIALELGTAELVAGDARDRVRNLPAYGGRQEFRWVVSGKPGTTIALQLTTDPVAGDRKEVTL